MILVLPKNEAMLNLLRHPGAEVRPFVDMTTPIEWPLDQFTIRRLADGDIEKVGEVSPQQFVKRRSTPSRFGGKKPPKLKSW